MTNESDSDSNDINHETVWATERRSSLHNEIDAAFFNAAANFEAVIKDGNNPHFESKFASLKSVLKAVTGALRDNDLLLRQSTTTTENRQVLWTVLTHVPSGQLYKSSWELHPVKADPQGEGSALTYARRYAIMTMLGLVPEDDDGNDASTANSRARQDEEDQRKRDEEQRRQQREIGTWVEKVKEAGDVQALKDIGNEANRARMLEVEVTLGEKSATLRQHISNKIAWFEAQAAKANQPAGGSAAPSGESNPSEQS